MMTTKGVSAFAGAKAAPDNLSQGALQNANQTRQKFVWGAGIECSFVPHLNIDQFEWTQHDRCWKEDFRRAREELGLTALRYALPWHKVEKEAKQFDWTAADERIAYAADLGLELYLDVMHFGVPLWLRQAVGDPEFPEALERFAEALVGRYGGTVKNWCPCNEPLVLALFSGDFGFWPPHGRTWRGYMPVLARVVQATSRAIRAMRRVDATANVILCDNVEHYKSRTPALKEEVMRRNLRRYLAMDLLLGRVDRRHPLFEWVTSYGMSEVDLEWFAMHPQRPDVLGMDYYPNSEWQLEGSEHGVQQRRSESPVGLYGIARSYYQRYGLPLMLTETSADGQALNREIWLEQTVEDCRRLREEGVPMMGYFWWPLIDQLDWAGALTNRIGKIHNVGIYNLRREGGGCLVRHATPLVEKFAGYVKGGEEAVGPLTSVVLPADEEEGLASSAAVAPLSGTLRGSRGTEAPVRETNRLIGGDSETGVDGNGEGTGAATAARRLKERVPEVSEVKHDRTIKATDRYGIVVFCHLRWGFVWQRPQQFLSRFARKHKVIFVEEPVFDLPEGTESRLNYHKVMPNVTVLCPHFTLAWQKNPKLAAALRGFLKEGISAMNEGGEFDRPLLWYYSPMDAAWSLGHFDNCGVVYDCMDELSNFTGAPAALQANEKRLLKHADIVFAGGKELGDKKREEHGNVHAFGCGVDYAHFAKASDPATRIPPDIDFMKRPILGWVGVVDERVDYPLVWEIARLRPEWSLAMVGPVVKVDPNLLPHAPNLFWLGERDYQQLPHYCRAFDVNMMCFALNAATEFINPTKGLEYMATGKPIVATPVKAVVRQWSDIVRVARTAEEFVAQVEAALKAGPRDERVIRGMELAKTASWDATVDTMQKLIREAIGSGKNKMGRHIEPMADPELEYTYVSTPGS
jgi:beta-glucosidase/6-phospho-beta-glucosidase/beta-galactosidase/glycosyltransferase involved in cell wall biosynthesis